MEIQLAELRQQKICDYLNSETAITIRRAAEICNTSEATARRDIDVLAKKGLVLRTHGGAVLDSNIGRVIVNNEKININAQAKEQIAQGALKYIQDGSSIFLDSGTTLLCLSRELFRFKRLTVITDNLDVAYQTQLDPSSTMFLLGGIVQREHGVTEGHLTEEMAAKLQVTTAFIGADAVDVENGIFNSHFAEVGIKKMMIGNSQKAVLLADHSKFLEKALIKVADLEEFDTVITDSAIESRFRSRLKKKIKNMVIV